MEEKQSSAKKNGFMAQSMKAMKGTSKSLPGFLAKNVDLICKWLKEYCKLFQKADDACIDYLKLMERSKRDEIVQDYVDIHTFIDLVQALKCKAQLQEAQEEDVCQGNISQNNEEKQQDEEVLQQDMG